MSVSHLVLLAAIMQAPAPESPTQRDARMAWWRDAQFGMFIHWGAYAVPAGTYNGERIRGIGEWIMSRAHIPIPDYEKYVRSEEHTSELQSRPHLVCRLLLEKKKTIGTITSAQATQCSPVPVT